MSPRKKLFGSTVMIRMPDDLRSGLEGLAAKSGRNFSDYCRMALMQHVKIETAVESGETPRDFPSDLRHFIKVLVQREVLEREKERKRHGKA